MCAPSAAIEQSSFLGEKGCAAFGPTGKRARSFYGSDNWTHEFIIVMYMLVNVAKAKPFMAELQVFFKAYFSSSASLWSDEGWIVSTLFSFW